jgi:hypothetical protein
LWDLEVVRAGRVNYALSAEQVGAIEETTAQDVKSKQESYLRGRSDAVWLRDYTLCNVWTAAFFTPLLEQQLGVIPTTAVLFSLMTRAVSGAELGSSVFQKVAEAANALAAEKFFFHWCLEFPEVFQDGGFSCVLGNPPWEKIKLQEKEFFAARDADTANAQNKAMREKIIKNLPFQNPQLLQSFKTAKYDANSQSRFVRYSGRFPLSAVGDINTYSIFTETTRKIIAASGKVGIIIPTGIATDDSTKIFIQSLLKSNYLESLYDFTNKGHIFQGVQGNISFSLLTISENKTRNFQIAAQLYKTEEIKKKDKAYTISFDDIQSINPNTLNVPVVSSLIDWKIIYRIHKENHVLEDENLNKNKWNISFLRMFDMTNDCEKQFIDKNQICKNKNSLNLEGNYLKKNGEMFVPLYESKLTDIFNHRESTFEGVDTSDMYGTRPRTIKYILNDIENPDWLIQPRYWVSQLEVENRIPSSWEYSWLVGFRNAISPIADSRSMRFTFIPKCGVGNSMPLIFIGQSPQKICALVANFNSLILDYVLKQKASGGNLNFYIIKQLPVLPPESYTSQDIKFISSRVLELVYTAWDMQPFAQDMGYEGAPFVWNPERRALLRAELDAKYAKLYGLTHEELRYILDPSDIYGAEFPSETFRVLKNKELKEYGEYRTQRLVLAAWDLLESGKPTPSEAQSIEDFEVIA